MTLPAELRAEYQRAAAFAHYAQQEVARGTRTQEDADTWTQLADLLHRAADALEWISVADRLPAIDEDVLLLLDEGQSVGCRDTKGWRIGNDRYGWDWHYNLNGAEPTHWLPLPATPEGD